jgi:long-chain acyl-CoA synthetase
MLRSKSAPLLLAERARREPQAVAFRAKKLGLYQERSWAGYATQVARCAHGLKALGLESGERIAIMGDACEEWLLADLGAQALGAIVYGIYPTASTAELEYQMNDGGAVLFVAEDQEYVDRILQVADRLPKLRWIVVVDASALFAYNHPKLRTFDDLMRAGGERSVQDLEVLAMGVSPDAPAFIVYTSGTSGHPKGALVSHGKHLAATRNLVDHYPMLAEREHRTVAYLPLCHILGRDIAVTLPLMSKLVPHFGEDVEDLPRTFFEVAPTVLFTVPRFLQKFAAQALVGIGSTTPVKRMAYQWAMGVARAPAGKADPRSRSPTSWRALWYSGPCWRSWAWTTWSWRSRAVRPCPPTPWRYGRCGASTPAKSTARQRKRARSSVVRARRSQDRATWDR